MFCRRYSPVPGLLLVIPPFVYPGALYHFEVAFGALFAGTGKIGYLQYPFQQIGEPDAVDPAFIERIAKTLIELHRNIFMIAPVYRGFKVLHSYLRYEAGCRNGFSFSVPASCSSVYSPKNCVWSGSSTSISPPPSSSSDWQPNLEFSRGFTALSIKSSSLSLISSMLSMPLFI